jgi:exopolysaccharide biosynthesis protein
MAAIMGALGCHTAVALDGGTSAQLQIRGPDGRPERWPGLRAVPMGVVFESVLPP